MNKELAIIVSELIEFLAPQLGKPATTQLRRRIDKLTMPKGKWFPLEYKGMPKLDHLGPVVASDFIDQETTKLVKFKDWLSSKILEEYEKKHEILDVLSEDFVCELARLAYEKGKKDGR